MPIQNIKYMALGALVLFESFKRYVKPSSKKNKVEQTGTSFEISELFINRNINHQEAIYSDFSSSPYRSSNSSEKIELTEEDISEIITIVNESRNLSENTKKVIKLNSALLLLLQQRRR